MTGKETKTYVDVLFEKMLGELECAVMSIKKEQN